MTAVDPKWFRQVLGQYPTGVCVVAAAVGGGGAAVGMVVGSFTSVSLNPPLIAFFPDRGSSSWAKLKVEDRFCVNILSQEQEPVCRKLASKDPEKFAGLAHHPSPRGAPIIDGAVAWIDCDRHLVQQAGDHDFVLGLVRALDVGAGGLPLLFFQGGYGRFAPSSLAASDMHGLLSAQLRVVDLARPEMERIAAELSAQCISTVRLGGELVVTASAGQAGRPTPATLVGQRLPFAPPTGSVFAAWLPPGEVERWLGARGRDGRGDASRVALSTVRARGYSVGLLNDAQRAFLARLDQRAHATSAGPPADLEGLIDDLAYDPAELSPETRAAVRLISAPVFDAAGEVALALTVHGFPRPSGSDGVIEIASRLSECAARVTAGLGGQSPVASVSFEG